MARIILYLLLLIPSFCSAQWASRTFVRNTLADSLFGIHNSINALVDSGYVLWSDTLSTVVTVSDTTVMSARISAKPDSGAVAFLNQAETITGNWVNTTNPWADNEIASSATWNNRKDSALIVEWSDTIATVITVSDTTVLRAQFATKPSWSDTTNTIITVADTIVLSAGKQPVEATLTDIADGTIAENLVNTANPWAVNEGGSGAATFTDGGILLGSGTDAFTVLGVATNGQIPVGDGTTDPVLATITGTANNVIVTNGAGTITLSSKRLMTVYAFNTAPITADAWLQDGGGTTFSTTAGHIMPFAGSIVGIGIQVSCSAKTSNGTVEVEVYANGVDVWDVATTINAVAVFNWSSTQNTGTDTFTAGQVISMNFDFTGFVGTLRGISVCLVVDG